MQQLRLEIEKRAHMIEGQGDGIFMVLIRMDEIFRAVRAIKQKLRRKQLKKRRKHR